MDTDWKNYDKHGPNSATVQNLPSVQKKFFGESIKLPN